MEPGEFQLLHALSLGKPVGEAIDAVFGESPLPLDELRGKLEGWFSSWSEQGWFCRPGGEAQ
jgi:hypothetical protein